MEQTLRGPNKTLENRKKQAQIEVLLEPLRAKMALHQNATRLGRYGMEEGKTCKDDDCR
jgi:hypothetical protein